MLGQPGGEISSAAQFIAGLVLDSVVNEGAQIKRIGEVVNVGQCARDAEFARGLRHRHHQITFGG